MEVGQRESRILILIGGSGRGKKITGVDNLLFMEANILPRPYRESEIAQWWDHCADRMIPLCPSPMVGSERITCGIYTVAADKLRLITGNFLKGACRQSCTKTPTCVPGWLGWTVFLLTLCIDSAPSATLTHKHTPLPRCGGITGGMTHLSESFKGFFHQPPRQSIPFSHASVSFPYSPEDYWGEDSCGSDGAGGVYVCVSVCETVCVEGGGGGGFHSDTKAMKRLDQWSVQWVPVCVYVCPWVWSSAL